MPGADGERQRVEPLNNRLVEKRFEVCVCAVKVAGCLSVGIEPASVVREAAGRKRDQIAECGESLSTEICCSVPSIGWVLCCRVNAERSFCWLMLMRSDAIL